MQILFARVFLLVVGTYNTSHRRAREAPERSRSLGSGSGNGWYVLYVSNLEYAVHESIYNYKESTFENECDV